MRITANHIEKWAQTRQAQAELPLWIRKLISATNSLSELSMPGGDSVYRPGWDGQINSIDTSPWVPMGKSVWEMGCNRNITSKANSDFKKRTKEFNLDFRQANSYVFVTPLRWHKKEEWLAKQREAKCWNKVKVIDADDLETWFENAPAVALAFGEMLGISGVGTESLANYWSDWSDQSSPTISIEAIQLDRGDAKDTLIKLIENLSPLITIEADSREEAAAFCSSVLLSHPLNEKSACISSAEGWRFVEANIFIQVVILTSTVLATTKAPRDGLTIIQPICHGDDIKSNSNTDNISIPRTSPDSFKQALIQIGEEENDARRLTSSAGRSWSVYRRLRALNPAIRQPSWIHGADKDSLMVLLLVGAWNSSSEGDRTLIEELTQKPYENIEDSLTSLLTIDDSPVVNIRNIWKAKSPIELLYLLAPSLSQSKLNRFICISKAVLTKPDPALELPEKDRWMASIYGKVRKESGVVITSLLNSLVKLKVFAETTELNISIDINLCIDQLAQDILMDANNEAWMSLSSYLPSIAEASPDAFLTCVENSLSKIEKPIASLFKNTTGTMFNNRCWYSGLLWALETIAWNASKLRRVTNVLIELDSIPHESKWSNSPNSTLQSFYRAFSPQVTASVDQKIQILESVIKKNESFAWKFILSLIPNGGSYGLNNSRPMWRDDDAGSESDRGVYYPHYISWLGGTLLKLASGKPERVAELIESYSSFKGEYRSRLISLIEETKNFEDEGKEIVLSELRRHLSLYQSDDINDKDENLEQLKNIYNAYQPQDLIVRYRWLFQQRWIDLPEGERRDYEKTERLRREYRVNAIIQIWSELGDEGIERLISDASDIWLVGNYLAEHLQNQDFDSLISFCVKVFINRNFQYQDQFISGVIYRVIDTQESALLEKLKTLFDEHQFTVAQKVSVIACLPPKEEVFTFIDGLGSSIANAYWKKIAFYRGIEQDLLEFALDKFVSLKRYSAAFKLIEHCFEKVPPNLVYEILQQLLTSTEDDLTTPSSYWLQKAIEYISNSGKFNQQQLASLEFSYLPVFNDPEHVPKNLRRELLSSHNTFVELICLVYKAEGMREIEDNSLANKHVAENAWKILHYGRGIPGLLKDKSIDSPTFKNWVKKARQAGKEMDRETMTDQSIGTWFSNCPEESDGVWPCYLVCELLEQADALEIRKAFEIGVYNNRGVVTRAFRDGGNLERELAEKYMRYAEKINNCFPQTAIILESIASSYKHDAKREDDEARLGDELC